MNQKRAIFCSLEDCVREDNLFSYNIVEDLEKKIVLNKAINLISKSEFKTFEKIAFNLRYNEGWTYKMIAEYLNQSENIVLWWFIRMQKYVLNKFSARKEAAYDC